MAQKGEEVNLEEVLENEVNDIWDIFFPYMEGKSEAADLTADEKSKPRRHMRFLTM